MNKAELENWLNEEQQKWTLLMTAIGEKRLSQPGVNGVWSMRDIIAHLTGWQRYLVAKLQAAANGQPEPPPAWPTDLESEDAINKWIYRTNRTRTARQVLDNANEVHEQLLTVMQDLPEDSRVETIEGKFHVVWVGEQRFAPGEFFHHFYDDHAADVLNWLK